MVTRKCWRTLQDKFSPPLDPFDEPSAPDAPSEEEVRLFLHDQLGRRKRPAAQMGYDPSLGEEPMIRSRHASEDAYDRIFERLFDAKGVWRRDAASAPAAPMDVIASDRAVVIDVELSGVRPADVELRIDGHVLTLRGRKRRGPRVGTTFECAERTWGVIDRRLALPMEADVSRARARLTAGVLHVFIPLRPVSRSGRARVGRDIHRVLRVRSV